MLSINPNEIMVFYNRKNRRSALTLTVANTMSRYVRNVDYNSDEISRTMWRVILKMLNISARELIMFDHPHVVMLLDKRELAESDWLEILVKRPDIIRVPIVVMGNRAVVCCRPVDIYQLAS